MREYQALGIETFVMSGYPHLEEAYRVAELLVPKLNLMHDTGEATLKFPHISPSFAAPLQRAAS